MREPLGENFSFQEASPEANEDLQAALLTVDDTEWLMQLGIEPEAITEQWLEVINEAIRNASIKLKNDVEDPEKMQLVHNARRLFYEKIGFDSDKRFSKSFSRLREQKYRKKNPPPDGFLHNCKELHGAGVNIRYIPLDILFGKDLSPRIAMCREEFEGGSIPYSTRIERNPQLLEESEAERATQQQAYLKRVSGVIGVEEHVPGLLEQYPRIAHASRKRLGALARIIAEHGDRESVANLKNPLAYAYNYPVEMHLTAIVENDRYVPRDIKRAALAIPASERREHVLRLLDAPETARKLGQKTLWAYFRYKPLTKTELSIHPDLAEYEQKNRIRIEPTRDKAWLDELEIQPTEDWISRMNKLIARGSVSLKSHPKAADDSAVNKILEARDSFLSELAHNKTGQALKQACKSYAETTGRYMGAPSSFIKIFRALNIEGIHPIMPVAEKLVSHRYTEEKVLEGISVVKRLEDNPNAVIQRTPTILRLSADKLETYLKRLKQDRLEREAKQRQREARTSYAKRALALPQRRKRPPLKRPVPEQQNATSDVSVESPEQEVLKRQPIPITLFYDHLRERRITALHALLETDMSPEELLIVCPKLAHINSKQFGDIFAEAKGRYNRGDDLLSPRRIGIKLNRITDNT